RFNDEGGVLLCTGRRMSIFDSLVLKPRTTGFVRLRLYGLRRDEIRSGFQNEIKSAKIELCVICRPRKVSGLSGSVRNWAIFFGKKIRDRTNPGCSEEDSGNESQIARYLFQVAGFQTFGSLTGTESFLTESLILAQNERWRRG